jgi:hypothetical protein
MQVFGPSEELDKLHGDIGSADKKIAEMVMPCPVELRNTMAGGYGKDENGNIRPEQVLLDARQKKNMKKYGATDWYDWCVKNWGTKWDADGLKRDEVGEYSYATAWGPFGNNLIAALSRKYPTLSFVITYDEPGMGFAGVMAARGGKIVMDRYGELQDNEFIHDGKVLFTVPSAPEDGTDEFDSDEFDEFGEYIELLSKQLESWVMEATQELAKNAKTVKKARRRPAKKARRHLVK